MTRRERVALHLKSGTSLEGFLRLHRTKASLVDAVFLDASQELREDQRKDIQGVVIVPRDNIDWYQVLD